MQPESLQFKPNVRNAEHLIIPKEEPSEQVDTPNFSEDFERTF